MSRNITAAQYIKEEPEDAEDGAMEQPYLHGLHAGTPDQQHRGPNQAFNQREIHLLGLAEERLQ